MPPPNTPLESTPTLKLKRGYQTEFRPGEDASDYSNPSAPGTEMREEKDQRERAAMILGCWEQLSWHSHMYGEVCWDFFRENFYHLWGQDACWSFEHISRLLREPERGYLFNHEVVRSRLTF